MYTYMRGWRMLVCLNMHVRVFYKKKKPKKNIGVTAYPCKRKGERKSACAKTCPNMLIDCMCLSVCLSLSSSHSRVGAGFLIASYHRITSSVCMSLSVFLCLCLSHIVCCSFSPSLPPPLSHSLPICLRLCLCLSLSRRLSLSLSLPTYP